ncbi:MAG: DUF2007 domain-containing protein [Bacteroidales bacterium]|nr:DUF2007 domain-containing protein [Bacteroidales bacterium]
MDTEKWANIYSTSKPYLAEIMKAVLHDNGIESVSINKQDSAYLFGTVELYVRVEKAFEAKQIILKHEE